jgi:hypothetical protein
MVFDIGDIFAANIKIAVVNVSTESGWHKTFAVIDASNHKSVKKVSDINRS